MASDAPRTCKGPCGELLPADAFAWGDGSRSTTGGKFRRRRPVCRDCFALEADENGHLTPRPWEKTLPTLPVWPVVETVRGLIDRENYALWAEYAPARAGFGSLEAVCKRLGLEPRTFRAWESGERQTLQFDQADRLLTNSPWLWWDVFNEQSVRLPIIQVVSRYRRTPKCKTQSPGWVTLPGKGYGDRGTIPVLDVEGYEVTDWAMLATIEHAFTGEEVSAPSKAAGYGETIEDYFTARKGRQTRQPAAVDGRTPRGVSAERAVAA